YYGTDTDDYVVAKTIDEALKLAIKKTRNPKLETRNLTQDEDVLDTWFSSWLWPIALFDGFTDLKNKELQYYYPTNTLVTGPEIIFFWVARMIVSGYEYLGDKPFSDVYFTGTVRDEKGRKMSKSLGNSPDPLNLIDQFGADAVRFGIMVSSPAGGDLLYDDKLCEQGRNFCNKIWNAMRLIKGWEVEGKTAVENSFAISWFDEKFNATLKKLNRDFNSFHVSEALKTLYSLIWDDFCSWYLEMVKPAHGETIDQTTYDKTIYYMERLMAVLHPFMPFITEEVWHILKERKEEECIIVGEWPAETDLVYNKDREELFKNIVTNVRNVRKENNIAPKQALALHVKSSTSNGYSELESTVKKLAVVDEIHYVKDKIEDAASFRIGKEEFFIHVTVNKKAEKKRISQELEYAKGFLKSVQSKLKNDSFVQNAPEKVVESERKKAADAEEKIKMLEASLKSL
ncbi:MAG: class I tRNA ligase family protein, partial [Bacteroidetes bacterium]|nr:class I tRNA ligase family protein [Bacteroidota bacterium]